MASNRIFSPWRSPRPRIWPTIHITAEVRQYARRLMYLMTNKYYKTELTLTGRQTDRQTDRQTETERQTDILNRQTQLLQLEVKSTSSSKHGCLHSKNNQRFPHFSLTRKQFSLSIKTLIIPTKKNYSCYCRNTAQSLSTTLIITSKRYKKFPHFDKNFRIHSIPYIVVKHA